MAVDFLNSGDSALVIQFGDRIDRAVSEQVLALAERLRAADVAGVVDMIPTYRSLLVQYDPLRVTSAELRAAAEALLTGDGVLRQRRRLWRLPACYEGQLAPDLQDVARRTGLAEVEIVRLHATTRYHVYMVGFLPGYPYMGDLPQELVLPRREDPRVRVPPGSVAIATTMTAVYPLESPGGWHLIGATPIPMFDATAEQPALLAPGDAVEFNPVDAAEFARLKQAVERREYRLAPETLGP